MVSQKPLPSDEEGSLYATSESSPCLKPLGCSDLLSLTLVPCNHRIWSLFGDFLAHVDDRLLLLSTMIILVLLLDRLNLRGAVRSSTRPEVTFLRFSSGGVTPNVTKGTTGRKNSIPVF